MRILCTIAVLGAALTSASASAQSNPPSQPPPPVPPMAPHGPTPPRLQVWRRPYFARDSSFANRPTLGMMLSATGSKRDTLGVFVMRVAPGGPAERAGIIEGDRIAAINDASLRVSGADLDDPYMMGIPAHRVRYTVSKLSPGSTVELRVYSNGRYKNVSVTAAKTSDVYKGRNRMMMFSMDGFDGIGPALAGIGPALEDVGPIVEGALDGIGPEIRLRVHRAMEAIPRDDRTPTDSNETKK